MRDCFICGAAFELGHRHTSRCLSFRRAYLREWRERGRLEGNPTKNSASLEWQRAYHRRPEVKQREAEYWRRRSRDPKERPKTRGALETTKRSSYRQSDKAAL